MALKDEHDQQCTSTDNNDDCIEPILKVDVDLETLTFPKLDTSTPTKIFVSLVDISFLHFFFNSSMQVLFTILHRQI